jgi:hypothetical protein
MDVLEEREQRRDLLLRVLEACPDPEQALAVAVRMEQFIIDGQISRENPKEVLLPDEQPSSEGPRKICNRVRWTGEDDANLRRLWQGNHSVEMVAQEFHRTPASIYARVRLLDLSPGRRVSKNRKKNNGKRKNGAATPDKLSPTANPEEIDGPESVGIDSVVHFLRTRDYSVVPKENGRYELDGRKILTAQELFERANKVRSHIRRPIWPALENGPLGAQDTNI